jgi:long-chain fatty acid transport protein
MPWRWLILVFMLWGVPVSVEAVSLRYFDVVVGGRAAQMGGAFTALADDATATYYNPAGLVQIETGSFSLSANAFDVQTYTVEDRLFGHDITLRSQAFYPTAWGVVKKVGEFRLALSAVVISNLNGSTDNRFQNVEFEGVNFETVIANRDVQEQIYLVGPSAAYRLRSGLMVGGTIHYWYGESREDQTVFVGNVDPIVQLETLNREDVVTQGVSAQVGLLGRLSETYSWGLLLRSPTYLRQEIDSEERSYLYDETTGEFNRQSVEDQDTETARRPLGMTIGAAFHPRADVTLALDLTYSYSTDYTSANRKIEFEPVVNGALGGEILLTPRVPLRAGLYTNRTAAPELNSEATRQDDHVDYYGVTLGTGYLDDISTLEVGLRYAYGTGENKDPTTGEQFDVRATVYTLFVSGSFRF